MALRTRFDPQPKGECFFSDAKRDEAYFHAGPYFLEQLRILLEDGWRHNDGHNSEEVLFDIYKPMRANNKGSQPQTEKLILPKTFASFLDISKANTWRTIFENPAIFKAGKKGTNKKIDLYIESSPPLSNIFYLLQVLAPGMLVIYHEYQIYWQDVDVKVSRVLPRASWIESNIEFMSKTDALLAAAKDRKIAFHEERTTRPQNNSRRHNSSSGTATATGTNAPFPAAAKKDQKTPSRKKKTPGRPRNNSHHGNSEYTIIPGYLNSDDMDMGWDWAVCDKDCGWCGRCRF